MKKFKLSIGGMVAMIAIVATLLYSCTDETSAKLGTAGKGETVVTLSLVVPEATTRTLSGTDEAVIKTVDVLVFKGGYFVESVSGTVNGTSAQVKLTKSVDSNDKYDLVVLANASSIVTGLATSDTKSEALGKLEKDMGTNKWSATTSTHPGFPMSSDPGETTLCGMVIDNSLNDKTIKLYRMVAKVSVVLSAGAKATFDLTSVHVYNYNTKGNLKPDFGVHPPTTTTHYTLNAKSSLVEGPQVYDIQDEITVETTGSDTKGIACSGVIYLFEADNTSSGLKLLTRPCLVIGGKYGTDDKPTYFRIDYLDNSSNYLNILRNHSYTVTVNSVTGRGYESADEAYKSLPVNMDATVVKWNDYNALNVDFEGQYELGVNRKTFTFYNNGATGEDSSNELLVTTTYTGAWKVAVMDGDDVATTGFWLKVLKESDAVANAAYSMTMSAGNLQQNFYLQVTQNDTSDDRTATIRITAGRLVQIITVVQGKKLQIYVGAFWRADQTGERIIKIPTTIADYAGKWMVKVLDYGDFAEGDIVFLAGDSEDTTVGTDAPGNAEDYQVNSTDSHAMGTATLGATKTDGITFRIGLKTKWNSSHPKWGDGSRPVRYARIVVLYGNNNYQHNRVIWLRQGHEPDYLMRPGDAGTGVGTRLLAVKYSPYNLTAPAFNGSGTSTMDLVIIGTRGGVMTDYPSQAGAFFQWAHTNGVIAYNAAVPNDETNLSIWDASFTVLDFWANIAATYESCPAGYRRPTDGDPINSTAVPVANVTAANSEMGQSLFLNPPSGARNSNTDNSIWGFYADGFFDRRTIGTQASVYNEAYDAAVATDNSNVAYIGRLFYNPYNNGSLFMPAAGCRNAYAGELIFTGTDSSYWSSTSQSGYNAYLLNLTSSKATRFNDYARYFGYSIRCVKE